MTFQQGSRRREVYISAWLINFKIIAPWLLNKHFKKSEKGREKETGEFISIKSRLQRKVREVRYNKGINDIMQK